MKYSLSEMNSNIVWDIERASDRIDAYLDTEIAGSKEAKEIRHQWLECYRQLESMSKQLRELNMP